MTPLLQLVCEIPGDSWGSEDSKAEALERARESVFPTSSQVP